MTNRIPYIPSGMAEWSSALRRVDPNVGRHARFRDVANNLITVCWQPFPSGIATCCGRHYRHAVIIGINRQVKTRINTAIFPGFPGQRLIPENLLALKGTRDVASNRRLGPRNSETSNLILDATERIMRDEGYAAVSSRRVAEVAGIRQGLVYYYFQTMDDLLLAAFKRRIDQGLARLERLVEVDSPIQAIWEDMTHTVDARMAYEFNALASHHEGIRAEVNRYLDQARNIEANAIAREAQAKGINLAPFTPAALAFLMYSASMTMARESTTGVTVAHEDLLAAVRWLLNKFA